MVKIQDVLKYTNDEDLQNLFKEKVAEEGGKEDSENIKKILGGKKIDDVDILLLIEKLPDNIKTQREELFKVFQNYIEQEDEVQDYYDEKYFKLGVMEVITIMINYFKDKETKAKKEERVISEIGIPIEFRNALDLQSDDKAILTLYTESKEIRLRKKIN